MIIQNNSRHRLLPELLAPVLALLAISACGPRSDAPHVENTGATSEALYGGVPDDDEQANDAVVALRVGDGSPFELCTGTLIAPNVVLTARHCVSENISEDIDCDETGTSHNGDQVGADVSPSTIHIMLGATPDFNAEPAANGLTILRPVGQTICNTDVAMVVLDTNITSVTPMRVRLSVPVHPGEVLRAVGYGKNDQNVRLGTRYRKDGMPIMAVGPVARDGTTGRPAIAGAEFEVGRSICQGDSGGPAISVETGAVIGVVSRGVDCDLDFGHIYTRTAGFRNLVDQTFAVAGGAPLEELVPVETTLAANEPGGAKPASTTSAVVAASASATSSNKGCSITRFGATDPRRDTGVGAGIAITVVALRRRRRRTT